MPAGSLVVGVDLAPIKPIPRVITFQSDITTDKCRATIRTHLKHLKADTVLHDGAPNVGTAWVQDAFSQAELVLQSMKLATEFLKEGGTFVTKVFRSRDYNPLLWVFKQLFSSVEATKPPSSRNVSAEIFVVCRGYIAPKHLDPKFLDPKHVFAELAESTPNHEAKVFNPEKKKRKRDGYEDGDWTQHKEISVADFINTTDPLAILGTYHKLSFQQPLGGNLALAALDRLDETTDEIRACCDDLRILGKKEFRNLLKWRLKVREKFGLAVKKKVREADGEEVAEITPIDEELAIQEELQRLRDNMNTKKKKERRKENERKRKETIRMQMHMVTPTEIGMEQSGPLGEDAMFAIKPIKRENANDTIAAGKISEIGSDEDSDQITLSDEESDGEEDRLERDLDAMYEQYQVQKEQRDSKLRAKKARKDYEADSWEGFSNSSQESVEESGEESGDDSSETEEWVDDSAFNQKGSIPLSNHLSNKAAIFFDQDIFRGIGNIEEVDNDDSAIEMEEDNEANGNSEQRYNDVSPNKKEHKSHTTIQPRDSNNYDRKDADIWKDASGTEPERTEDPRTRDGRLGRYHSFP